MACIACPFRRNGAVELFAYFRRQVAEIYAAGRYHPDPAQAWHDFRARRDALFKCHPQTPLSEAQRASFVSLPYFPYDPAWRVVGTIDSTVQKETFIIHLLADGEFRYTRIARVHFNVQGTKATLSLYWIEGYGGGLFLPFQDASNGRTTYSGGRYLYDTIKAADLSRDVNELMLDFNYAYNPSCAYNEQWVCPLSPAENRLAVAILAGERV